MMLNAGIISQSVPGGETEMRATELPEAYRAVRALSLALVTPLSAEDCCVQSMPDASPAKWHLGHTTWFFETFILEPRESGFRPFHPAFRVLFNSCLLYTSRCV